MKAECSKKRSQIYLFKIQTLEHQAKLKITLELHISEEPLICTTICICRYRHLVKTLYIYMYN